MALANSLHSVAAVVESLENIDADTIVVTPREGAILADQQVSLDVDVNIPLSSEAADAVTVVVRDATLRDGDELRVTLTVQAPTDPPDGDGSETLTEGTTDDERVNGAVSTGTVVTAGGGGQAVATVTEASGGPTIESDSSDLPAYRDPEALARVYEEYDTFAEMTEALGADVTPQTVRKYMIDHGIHEPSSASTITSTNGSSDAPADSRRDPDRDSGERDDRVRSDLERDEFEDGSFDEAALAEDVDLPDDVTVEQLKEGVQTSKTLFEIQQELGVDREHAREVLRELNLLELVHGRVATGPEEVPSIEEINDRIRAAALDEY